jgi:hypothetical protein
MVQIPLNKPIPLHQYTKEANNAEALQFENVVLTEADETMIYIKSEDLTRTLTLLTSGRCVFDDESKEKPEKFKVVEFPSYMCLKSNSTDLLLQFHEGNFHCLSNNHEDTGTIVFPKNAGVHPLVWCLGAAVVGAALIPAIGLGAAALVPTAMSTFGTVVAGVGTIHAPLAAGGCAAILQSTSAALLTTNAAAGGAAIGAAVGLITKKKDDDKGPTGTHDMDTANTTDTVGANVHDANGDDEEENLREDEEPDDGDDEAQDEDPDPSGSKNVGEFV